MSSTVNIFVVSPDIHSERRFDSHVTVEKLKNKLELITGIPAANQSILLLDSEGDSRVVATLTDDTKQLRFYGLRDWNVLKVEDTNPSVSFTGQLTDVAQVDKFELTDKEYAERQDTVLAYKQQHKMGRFASNEESAVAEPPVPANITVGSRCEVESSEQGLSKRGTIRFVGQTKFSKGIWVGIEYDEPFGKNDGSVQGEQYFQCRQNYGVFVRQDKVRIGEYPVEDIDLDEEM